jgi:DNA-binding GntR family transcriptional regulator
MSETKHAHASKSTKFAPATLQEARSLQDSRGDLTPAYVHWFTENALPREVATAYAERMDEYNAALKEKK